MQYPSGVSETSEAAAERNILPKAGQAFYHRSREKTFSIAVELLSDAHQHRQLKVHPVESIEMTDSLDDGANEDVIF